MLLRIPDIDVPLRKLKRRVKRKGGVNKTTIEVGIEDAHGISVKYFFFMPMCKGSSMN